MGLLKKELLNKRIGVDTCVLLHFLNDDDIKKRKLLGDLLSQTKEIYASTMTFVEAAVHPWRKKDKKMIDFIEDLPRICENFSYVDMTILIASAAAFLRANYSWLKTPDAIHMATAMVKKCDYFLTCDKKLKKIKEIRVVVI